MLIDPIENKTPLDLLLEEQGQLDTPVARVSKKFDEGVLAAESYTQLIPLRKPSTGEQYAFEVDLDLCSGCKGCVTACHSLNGLDEQESWRDVGLLHGGNEENPVLQTVTSACHHCEDPACMNGCPVGAYEKDNDTGIVHHLDDQCIGCEYCILKCPYDVPKYSKELKIVRKCDMCHNRLKDGEAPACVQACPTEAIKITLVQKEEVIQKAENQEFLSGTPDPSYTQPATQFISKRNLPDNLEATDKHDLLPQHAHWPLVIMLTLTQVSAGLFIFDALLRNIGIETSAAFATIAFLILNLGLGASVFHLGHPLKAWRFFLGLKTSWLSREIVALNIFAGSAGMYLAAIYLPFIQDFVSLKLLSGATAFSAILGVFSSVMVYVDTRRPCWKLSRSSIKFYGTTLCCGFSGMLLIQSFFNSEISIKHSLLLAIMGGTLLLWDLSFLKHAKEAEFSHFKKSAKLILSHLRREFLLRQFIGFLAYILFPLIAVFSQQAVLFFALSFILAITTEIAERYLFFRSVIAFKMPGGISSSHDTH